MRVILFVGLFLLVSAYARPSTDDAANSYDADSYDAAGNTDGSQEDTDHDGTATSNRKKRQTETTTSGTEESAMEAFEENMEMINEAKAAMKEALEIEDKDMRKATFMAAKAGAKEARDEMKAFMEANELSDEQIEAMKAAMEETEAATEEAERAAEEAAAAAEEAAESAAEEEEAAAAQTAAFIDANQDEQTTAAEEESAARPTEEPSDSTA